MLCVVSLTLWVWTISENMKRQIEAVEIWFIRRILRISWTERVSNKKGSRKSKSRDS